MCFNQNNNKPNPKFISLQSKTSNLKPDRSSLLESSIFNLKSNHPAFTIVELLLVIVIIGILAAIITVSYSGIATKAVIATIQSDISNAKKQLELYEVEYGQYPSSVDNNNCPVPADTKYCLNPSDDNIIDYDSPSSQEFDLIITHDDNNNGIADEAEISYVTDENGVIARRSSGNSQASGWKQISNGEDHSCAIDYTDKLYCWGKNEYGELGNGTQYDGGHTPIAVNTTGVLAGKTIKQVSASYDHTCAIASDDMAYCWGYNGNSELGNNDNTYTDSFVPVAVDTTGVLAGKTAKYIKTGGEHTCMLASDNQVYCWGSNSSGQLGNNTYDYPLVPVAVDTTGVLAGKTIKSIAVGYEHSCAVSSDNQIYCWGYGGDGELGDGNATTSPTPVAVDMTGVLADKTIKEISSSSDSTCVIASDNKVYCWGSNSYGELADNTDNYIDSYVPVAIYMEGILSGKTVKSLSMNTSYRNRHFCVIASDDNAYCWGGYNGGLLGNGLTDSTDYAVAVDTSGVLSGKTMSKISTGAEHTCAIANDHKIYCWGNNDTEQLGVYNLRSSAIPVAVMTSGALSDKTINQVTASGGYHTCAIASDNMAYCWGSNQHGMLGIGSILTTSYPPTAVDTSGVLASKTIKQIEVGTYHTCAIASDDQAYCWGSNGSGQLGDNSTTSSSIPVAVYTSGVLSGKTIKQISTGYNNNCAIASDDKAYCWGSNSQGKLGDNSTTSRSTPVAVYTSGVLSGKIVKQISTGEYHTCAVASDGSSDQAYCWGLNNYGQLGNSSTISRSYPVAVNTSGVLTGKTIKQIAVGEYHTCAIASDDQAYCWGFGSNGNLGNNSNTSSSVPAAVYTSGALASKTVTSISSLGSSTYVIASDNKIYRWGGSGLGNTPVVFDVSEALSEKNIKSISTSGFQGCLVTTENYAYCWGSNSYGQFGDGSIPMSLTPLATDF